MGTNDKDKEPPPEEVTDAESETDAAKAFDSLSDILDEPIPDNLAKLIGKLKAIKPS